MNNQNPNNQDEIEEIIKYRVKGNLEEFNNRKDAELHALALRLTRKFTNSEYYSVGETPSIYNIMSWVINNYNLTKKK